MLTVRKITKSFGQNLILKDVSFTLKRGERFGMVGSNGVGKTTLLQIIKGNIKSDLGNIEKSGDIRICYIPQEIMPISKIETGREYLIRIFGSEFASILDDRECHSILSKLSMSLSDIEKPLDVLSGGLKAKVALLPFFLSRADVFLLDEPTNNLDLSVLLFLEQRIIKSLSTFLIVSHDRKFLDRIVSKTVEIDEHYHTSIIYEGGFSEYLKEREKRVRREWQRYKEYQTEIKRLKDSSQGQKDEHNEVNQVQKNIVIETSLVVVMLKKDQNE